MHAGEVRFRTLAEYREQMRQIVGQGLVDIMLMSASSNEVLTIQREAFREQPRHARRAGQRYDAISSSLRGGQYISSSRRGRFAPPAIDHIQCGHVDCGR